jgi:pimeloyl-ACP methyl ester carboxylesterase
LMLNGKLGMQQNIRDLLSEPPSLERAARICPTACMKAKQYKVPTVIIHGDQDEVASYESASNLFAPMSQQRIKSGLLTVKNGRHIHDPRLNLAR